MLEIKNLSIEYQTDSGMLKAVNNVNFSVQQGEIVGLVGESGCGKSTVLFSILGLVSSPGRILEGQILFDGKELTQCSPEQWRELRGNKIAMIFQDPMTSLNPSYRVGEQIREVMKTHRNLRSGKTGLFKRYGMKKQEQKKVMEIMEEVGIPAPEQRYFEYPHQFSGGMQQRALIAMALAGEPKLLLADEPTTALDVTIQAQILDLLKKVNRLHNTSVILVTHDMGVASEFCDELAVMYAGQIVERGPTQDIMRDPKHPYTQGLLRSIPSISAEKKKIEPIPGSMLDLLEMKNECTFFARCPYAEPACKKSVEIMELRNRQIRCVLYEQGSDINDQRAVSQT